MVHLVDGLAKGLCVLRPEFLVRAKHLFKFFGIVHALAPFAIHLAVTGLLTSTSGGARRWRPLSGAALTLAALLLGLLTATLALARGRLTAALALRLALTAGRSLLALLSLRRLLALLTLALLASLSLALRLVLVARSSLPPLLPLLPLPALGLSLTARLSLLALLSRRLPLGCALFARLTLLASPALRLTLAALLTARLILRAALTLPLLLPSALIRLTLSLASAVRSRLAGSILLAGVWALFGPGLTALGFQFVLQRLQVVAQSTGTIQRGFQTLSFTGCFGGGAFSRLKVFQDFL